MPLIIIRDGEVCRDCVFMIANGESPEEYTEAQADTLAMACRYWTLSPTNEQEGDTFSTRPCVCCGSNLYGVRHHAVQAIDSGRIPPIQLSRVWFQPSQIYSHGLWQATATCEGYGQYDMSEEGTVSRRTARLRMQDKAVAYFAKTIVDKESQP